LDPDIAATHDIIAAAQRLLGHEQQALKASEDAVAVMRRQQDSLDKVSGPTRLATAEGRVMEARADFAEAGRLYRQAVEVAGVARASQAAASLPRALAADHDIAAAWTTLDDLRGRLSEDALTDAAVAPGLVAMQAGDWATAERYLRKADATAALFGPAGAAARLTQIAPYLAITLAMSGQLEAARLTVAATPTDCYACIRARAIVAGRSGDGVNAERLFKAAAGLSPGLPAAYLEWGQTRLALGDPEGAVEQARKAAQVAPRWSDPQQLWGEALLRKNDLKGAAKRFRQAADLSPHWGAPLLREGQILLRSNDRAGGLALLRQARGRSLTPAQRAELDAALR
jgi:tetratricopeptide (TPR) repeat protein